MALPTEVEQLLVKRIRAGESDAWSDMIDRYEGRLLAFVESRLSNRSAAEDIVQEAFMGFLNFPLICQLGVSLLVQYFVIHVLRTVRKSPRTPWSPVVSPAPSSEHPAKQAAGPTISGQQYCSYCTVQ